MCPYLTCVQAILERSSKQDLEALAELREQMKVQTESEKTSDEKYVSLNDEYEGLKQRWEFLSESEVLTEFEC